MIQKITQFKHRILKISLFKHISTVFLWDSIAKFIGLVTTVILIRMLPKEDYALYTFFWAATMFFVGFISSGVDMAYVRFAAEEYSVKKKMPHDIFVFSIGLCLIAFLILSPIIIIFSKQLSLLMFKNSLYNKPLFLGFIAAIGMFFITMLSRYYQVQEKYKNAGFIISLQNALFLLLLFVIIALAKLSFERIVFAQIVVIAVTSILFIYKILKNNLLKEELILNFKRFEVFFKASFWLILYFTCSSLFYQLDIFMISRLMTSDDLANYGVAFKYYSALMLMYPSIRTVLKVRTSKIDMVESVEKQRTFLKKWMKMTALLFVPVIGLVILFSDYFMTLFNGPMYIASILPFKILAVCATSNYVFSAATDVFRAMRKFFLLFCLGFIALIMNFLANLWLIPIYGINGAAIATLISSLMVDGLAMLYIIKKN